MRIFDHPIHTLLVHFPIAFWTLASLCDGLAYVGLTDTWRVDAILIGLGVSIGAIAMIPGLIDLAKLPGEAEKSGLTHMAFMLAAWCFYLGSLFLRIEGKAFSPEPGLAALTLSIIGFCCLMIGGFFGGELVYRYGAGQLEQEQRVEK